VQLKIVNTVPYSHHPNKNISVATV